MPTYETVLLIDDDPHLVEHFKSGELVADPAEIEIDVQTLAVDGLKESVGRFLTSKKTATVVILSALGAGLIAGSHRTAHS